MGAEVARGDLGLIVGTLPWGLSQYILKIP